jgi:CRP-like cAMP-binding protein/thioredoxin reductase/Fe-S-cluster-containing hydrogenase component 2
MPDYFDIAILGAGPAGIGAATSAAHHKLSHVLFEKGHIANTIHSYQLRKHVMAEPGRLPLRAHCRFEAGNREKILQQFTDDLSAHRVNLVQAEVTSIEKREGVFHITYGDRSCTARHVVLAIGVQGSPRKLGVPGEEMPHVAYTLADPGLFSGRSIVVVGGGDAAIENALALAENNTVYLVNRSDEFARAKDANARLILAAIGSDKVRCFYSATITRVDATAVSIATPQGEVSVPCDHLIARLGCVMPRKFLESIGIQFPNKDPNSVPVVNARYESSVPGLFIIGALIGYPLIKQAINQGYEVIEAICGRPCEPADQPLLEERFKDLPGGFAAHYARIGASLPLFADVSEPQMREMLIDSTLSMRQQGDVVFQRNDYTDTFWSVVSGSVEVEIDSARSVRLGKGDFFGEMGLISGRRRVATVRVAEPNTLLVETPRKQILKLIASVDSVRRALDEVFMKRTLQSAIFPSVTAEFLDTLAKSAVLRKLMKGEVLFNEGEVGDNFYVIRKGSVKVSRRNKSGKDIPQTYIPAGGYVGEMAILTAAPVPRSATVTAAVACEVITISKPHFLEVLQGYPAVREIITRVAEERRIQNIVTDSNEQTGALLEFMASEGLTDAENVLLIDSDLCVGCDNCEAACAATHNGYSRLDRKGGKSFASIQVPVSCRHCENPLCMTDCPPNALTRLSSGEVVIRDSCIGCGNCVSNCPYGVIKLVYDGVQTGSALMRFFGLGKYEKGPAKAAKCDQCHTLAGGPACVRACPTGAAMRVNAAKLVHIAKAKGI